MPTAKCSIDRCDSGVKAKGLCNKHWLRLSKHGDPNAGQERQVSSYDGAVCSVADCGKAARKRGWCDAHYYRWRKHGSPQGGGTEAGVLKKFIEKAIGWTDATQCLLWPYGTNNGYASARIAGYKSTIVHRYVCEKVHGSPPSEELDCAHSCGRGADGCINPLHLRWSTRSENVADMEGHGTANRGERNNWAKLSEDEVRHIKSMKSKATQKSLGEQFGVSDRTIQSIHAEKSWAWLTVQ